MKKMLLICAFLTVATAWAGTTYWDESQYTHRDLAQPTAVEGADASLSLDGWIRDVVPTNVLEVFSSMAQGLLLLFR